VAGGRVAITAGPADSAAEDGVSPGEDGGTDVGVLEPHAPKSTAETIATAARRVDEPDRSERLAVITTRMMHYPGDLAPHAGAGPVFLAAAAAE
jgi:hypothetical protein